MKAAYQHLFHIDECSFINKQNISFCSEEHSTDDECPCPRREVSSTKTAVFQENKENILLNNIFTNENSASPTSPSSQDIDQECLDRIDLLKN